MDETDRALVNHLQDGIDVVERPFESIACALGISEREVCGRLQRLLDKNVLSRFGPMIDAEAMGGAFTLAAMSVPSHEFERVAAVVNAHREVAHNYRREHRFNMWFVVAAEHPAAIDALLHAIESDTGYRVIDLPKRQEYFLRLKLDAGTYL